MCVDHLADNEIFKIFGDFPIDKEVWEINAVIWMQTFEAWLLKQRLVSAIYTENCSEKNYDRDKKM